MYCNIIITKKPIELKAIEFDRKSPEYCSFMVRDIEDCMRQNGRETDIDLLIRQGIRVLEKV